jgi:hypothetical protein
MPKPSNDLAYYLTASEAVRATLCIIKNSRDAEEEKELLGMLGLSRRAARAILESRKESGEFGTDSYDSTNGPMKVSVYPLLMKETF